MVELSLEPISPPLVAGDDGVIRVGGTRVTLDSVVHAFVNGAAAEEIAVQFPSLALADVYTAISYFLHHRSEVERYLEKRRSLAEENKAANEAKFDPVGIRGRLLARK